MSNFEGATLEQALNAMARLGGYRDHAHRATGLPIDGDEKIAWDDICGSSPTDEVTHARADGRSLEKHAHRLAVDLARVHDLGKVVGDFEAMILLALRRAAENM